MNESFISMAKKRLHKLDDGKSKFDKSLLICSCQLLQPITSTLDLECNMISHVFVEENTRVRETDL